METPASGKRLFFNKVEAFWKIFKNTFFNTPPVVVSSFFTLDDTCFTEKYFL